MGAVSSMVKLAKLLRDVHPPASDVSHWVSRGYLKNVPSLALSSRVSLSVSFSVRQPRIPGRSGSGSDVRNAGLPWRERSREKQAKSSWGPGERGWDWEDRDGADDAVQASKRRWDLARASKLGDSPLSGGGLCHCHFPSNSMTLTDCQQHTATVNTSPAAGFFFSFLFLFFFFLVPRLASPLSLLLLCMSLPPARVAATILSLSTYVSRYTVAETGRETGVALGSMR